jgi:four helix bundle protein
MRNFRELKIWQNGMFLVKQVYELAALLPENEKYGLRFQITRAAVSIPSNIAEGSSRSSQTEFRHYLVIALGSLFELETQILLVKDLNLIQFEFSNIFGSIEEEQKMVAAFIQKIKQAQAQNDSNLTSKS